MRRNATEKPVCDPAPCRVASAADGFILVAVLLILAALAALVGVFSIYSGAMAVSTRVAVDRLHADALITAGIELTADRLIGLDDDSRPGSGAFSFRLGGATVAVAFRTEHARIDLNLAPRDLLSGLLATLGAKKEDADFAAERIIGWRKTNDGGARNEEADRYKSAGLNYSPRQAPFENIAELNFVLGLSPALVERALPFLTLFNGRAEIDVNEAAPQVVAALPHMTPDVAAAILSQRNPQNVKAVWDLLGQARANVALGGPGAVRAFLQITLDSGRRVNAEVVLLPLEATEPYLILSWRDDFDGAF
jgi:general secretion pathway protein K